jgi:agmatinase
MALDFPKSRPQYATFYGAPPCVPGSALAAEVACLGAPFDLGTTHRPGARFGPAAVRAASAWWPYLHEDGTAAGGWFDLELGRWILSGVTMADCGDVEIAPAAIAANLEQIAKYVAWIVNAGSLPAIVGGDHSITYPALRAFADRGPIHVVQFDTHQDFVDERRGARLGHGNVMRRVSELPFVTGISQIGIRGLQKFAEPVTAARAYGVCTVTAAELRRDGPAAVARCVPAGAACYLTVDVDVLDMALAPGTGTPEPGGLTFAELREAARAVTARGHVVGLDLVEVSPPYDWAEVTARSAARLLLDVLAAIFGGESSQRPAVHVASEGGGRR